MAVILEIYNFFLTQNKNLCSAKIIQFCSVVIFSVQVILKQTIKKFHE